MCRFYEKARLLPEEPALQAPARTTTFAFFGAALTPRTSANEALSQHDRRHELMAGPAAGMAAAKDAAAAAATKAHLG